MRKRTSKKKSSAPTPPKKRVIVFVPPHSPFQKMLAAKKIEGNMSYSELAKRIRTPQGTIYRWLHNENGIPDPKSLSPKRIQAIGAFLGVSEQELRKILDESSSLFRSKQSSPPPPDIEIDTFHLLISHLKAYGKKTIPVAKVIQIAEKIRELQKD